jgi:hypothetical protein
VLVNDNLRVNLESPGVEMVKADFPADFSSNASYQVLKADLVDKAQPWRHDSNKLALTLLRLLQ